MGVALVGLLAAMHSADAQKRRLPGRTEEVPDTESGRPAASAEKPTFKGRLMIYGPASLPVTPPPEHVKPAPESTPVAAPAPAPVAAPAPKPEPAPVVSVTPVPAPPKPVATPIPAPAPIPVAKPAPAPEPLPPVAKPAPAPEPPPPVAKPAPAAVPPPAPATALAPSSPTLPPPTPPPALVVKPVPPSVVIAAPAPKPGPIVRSAPIIRPEPVVRPEPARAAPAAPAAAPRRDIAIAAPSAAAVPAPAAPTPIDARLIENIFACLSPGLPQDWKKAWVEITDMGAGKEQDSKFFVTNQYGDDTGEPLVPCNAPAVTRGILSLNEKLPPDRRGWTRARLVIDSEGDYELSYDYPR
jgi:hypothetical protein